MGHLEITSWRLTFKINKERKKFYLFITSNNNNNNDNNINTNKISLFNTHKKTYVQCFTQKELRRNLYLNICWKEQKRS